MSIQSLHKLLPDKPYPLLALARGLGYGRIADAFIEAANEAAMNTALNPFSIALRNLGIKVEAIGINLEDLPKAGEPLLVTANHPYGMAEGLAIASILSKSRPDFKIMVNKEVGNFLPFGEQNLLLVDIKSPSENKKINVIKARAKTAVIAMHHLKKGGALVILPAGRISRPPGLGAAVTDPPWYDYAAALLKKGRKQITSLPIYVEGHNSAAFEFMHAIGLSGPTRALLFAKETLRLARKPLRIHIAQPIKPDDLPTDLSHAALTDFLRQQTYALQPAHERPAGHWTAKKYSDQNKPKRDSTKDRHRAKIV